MHSNKTSYTDVATLLKNELHRLGSIERGLSSEQDKLKKKSTQIEGAMVSLQQTFRNAWPYLDSQSLQKDPDLQNLRSFVHGLKREQQPRSGKLLLDRDAADQAEAQEKLRSQVSRELLSALKTRLTTGLGNAHWSTSLCSCENLDSLVDCIYIAFQSHDESSSSTRIIPDQGFSGASGSQGDSTPSQLEGKGLEGQDINSLSTHPPMPAHHQINALVPVQMSCQSGIAAYPTASGEIVPFNRGREVELRGQFLDELKSSIKVTFGSGLFGHSPPPSGLHATLDVIKQSFEARKREHADTMQALEAKSGECRKSLIALNEAQQSLQHMQSEVQNKLEFEALLQQQVRRLQACLQRLVAELQISWPTTICGSTTRLQPERFMRDLTQEEAIEEMEKLNNELVEARGKRCEEREQFRVSDLKMQLQLGLGRDFFLQGCSKLEDCQDLDSIGDAVKKAKESHDEIRRKLDEEVLRMQERMNRCQTENRELHKKAQDQLNRRQGDNEQLQREIVQYQKKVDQLTHQLEEDARRAKQALENVQNDLKASKLKSARLISQLEGSTRLNDALSHNQTVLPLKLSSFTGESGRDAEVAQLKSRLGEIEQRLQN